MQFDDPSFAGGANKESLNDARSNFKKSGASSPRFVGSVRGPVSDVRIRGRSSLFNPPNAS